jgi:hypothetical protein
MPVQRRAVEESLARINAARPADQQVKLESFTPQRFVLSFPDRPMPEGQCIDQDFSEIQFALLEQDKVYTGIQGGRQDEADRRYHIEYAVTEWD